MTNTSTIVPFGQTFALLNANSLQFLAIKHDFICFQHCWNVSTVAVTQRRYNYGYTFTNIGCCKWTFRPIRKKNVWKRVVNRKKAVGLSRRESAKAIWDIRYRFPICMVKCFGKYCRICE